MLAQAPCLCKQFKCVWALSLGAGVSAPCFTPVTQLRYCQAAFLTRPFISGSNRFKYSSYNLV